MKNAAKREKTFSNLWIVKIKYRVKLTKVNSYTNLRWRAEKSFNELSALTEFLKNLFIREWNPSSKKKPSYVRHNNGFRQGYSTEHAILDIRIQSNMDAGDFSCGVFIDLKKAFDTVDHSILIHKLDFYGFRGIINAWFRSYLQDKTQITVIDQRSSNKSVVTYGVPQGSVLRPLLFLLYVNDIYSSSSKLNFKSVCRRHRLSSTPIKILSRLKMSWILNWIMYFSG